MILTISDTKYVTDRYIFILLNPKKSKYNPWMVDVFKVGTTDRFARFGFHGHSYDSWHEGCDNWEYCLHI